MLQTIIGIDWADTVPCGFLSWKLSSQIDVSYSFDVLPTVVSKQIAGNFANIFWVPQRSAQKNRPLFFSFRMGWDSLGFAHSPEPGHVSATRG